MLSLRLLGGLHAQIGGQPLAGRAAHRKRLALVALLAIARSRTMSRDKLAALLWPEYDAERGRHQLATALYDLRKAGGEDLIVAAGDDLRLNPARLTCDLWKYETLLAAGEQERAVECYAGPLLDGFHLPDAVEFERWVDSERDRFAHLYARALEELAAAAEASGDFSAAVMWWRRLAVQDPYSSRVALGLMNSLAAAGDSAAAIQHAGIHTILLREDLGAEPSPEVLASADRLRAGQPISASAVLRTEAITSPLGTEPVRPGTESSQPESALPVPDATATDVHPRRRPARLWLYLVGQKWAWTAGALGMGAVLLVMGPLPLLQRTQAPVYAEHRSVPMIAVLPLKNDTGDPGQEHFADAMTEALIAELARESGLRVISRTSVMPYRNPSNRKLPEIARELNADLIVEGSFFRAGDRVRITAHTIETGQRRRSTFGGHSH